MSEPTPSAPIDKAVILAAGRGNRISRVFPSTPKPLLPIDGPQGSLTFLDWHLLWLGASGAREIYLVGNNRTFGAPLLAQRLLPADVRVTWILNPTEDLTTSGSAHSLWFACHSSHRIFDGRSRVVLMDADLIYDPSVYRLLAGAPTPLSKLLVHPVHEDTAEEVLAFARGGEVRLLGKGLPQTPLVRGMECLGECAGILLWEPDHHTELVEVTDWILRFSTAKTRSEHEDVQQRMLDLGLMAAVPMDRAHTFMECDTPEEYERLLSDAFPRLARQLDDEPLWRAALAARPRSPA